MTTTHTDRQDVRRIGFMADTHVKTAADLPAEALRAFAGADLIIHCGHIGNIELLDRLQEVAQPSPSLLASTRIRTARQSPGHTPIASWNSAA